MITNLLLILAQQQTDTEFNWGAIGSALAVIFSAAASVVAGFNQYRTKQSKKKAEEAERKAEEAKNKAGSVESSTKQLEEATTEVKKSGEANTHQIQEIIEIQNGIITQQSQTIRDSQQNTALLQITVNTQSAQLASQASKIVQQDQFIQQQNTIISRQDQTLNQLTTELQELKRSLPKLIRTGVTDEFQRQKEKTDPSLKAIREGDQSQ